MHAKCIPRMLGYAQCFLSSCRFSLALAQSGIVRAAQQRRRPPSSTS